MSYLNFAPLQGRPIIFGEVLFDAFSDGREVLGGAPFNVAWHLQGFGLEPLMISRIGADPQGAEVRERMAGWGMDGSGLQRDNVHPTGRVDIQLDGSAHTFSILPDQAYDHIEAAQALAASADIHPSLLYFGTLAQRSMVSHKALRSLLETTGLPSFVDINLRDPWWEPDILDAAIEAATWVKLNDEELDRLRPDTPLHEAAEELLSEYTLELLVVTQGEDGALYLTADVSLEEEPVPVPELVDTVGAGDAFSAVTILGLHRGWSLADTLERALEFASLICGYRGATVDDPELYRQCLSRWSAD